jgi:predicted component of type VI protein secretion system
MRFTAPFQPTCLGCRRKIPKHCDNVYLSKDAEYHNKSEVERATNQRVVSIRYSDDWHHVEDDNASSGSRLVRKTGKLVSSYSTWDGESYVDEFFCNGTCMRRFAYAAARRIAPKRK